jgi:hypothetical protein
MPAYVNVHTHHYFLVADVAPPFIKNSLLLFFSTLPGALKKNAKALSKLPGALKKRYKVFLKLPGAFKKRCKGFVTSRCIADV